MIRGGVSGRPICLLALMVLAALLPFIAKPLNIDDPLFVWTARQIQSHPENPYGFRVNWVGFEQPMPAVTKNPPLACYYLALWGTVFGWSEMALHLAMLFPALAAIWGTYRLAGRFCEHPLLAASATFFTPVFLVSSTTLMCDVMMLAFWTWAMVLWIEGTTRNDFWRLAGSTLLISLAALTKYFGICLMPLLVVWSLIGRQRFKGSWWWFLLPLAMLVIYQTQTYVLYGRGLLSDAGEFAVVIRATIGMSRLEALLVGLSFLGGCLAVAIFFAPLLWRWRQLAFGIVGTVLLAFGLSFWKPGGIAIQVALWAAVGISALVLAVLDVVQRRSADSWLLALWLWGTFLFASLFNWTINARSILPAAVPVAILIVRRLEWRFSGARMKLKLNRPALGIPLALSAALAVCVAGSDYFLARAVRRTAQEVQARYGQEGGALWFGGHWGFQYYMSAAGASALDINQSVIQPGQHLVLPLHNSGVYPIGNTRGITKLETFTAPGSRWLTTMSARLGAGFYASIWGPLPFAFGRVPPEEAEVYVLNPSVPAAGAR